MHWHVAEMQPPMVDNLDKLLALSRSVGAQEGAVNQCAQQLLEVSVAALRPVAHIQSTQSSNSRSHWHTNQGSETTYGGHMPLFAQNNCTRGGCIHTCSHAPSWYIVETIAHPAVHCRCRRCWLPTLQQSQILRHPPALTVSWLRCSKTVQGNSRKYRPAR